MHYCFIISNARLDYFNIEKIKLETKDVQFILIYQKRLKNNPSEQFLKSMDDIFELDVITYEKCKDIIDNYKIENANASIVCTDEPHLLMCATLREHFKLRGAQAYQYIPFINKIIMKQILGIHGIKTPKFINLDFKYAKKSLHSYHQYVSLHLKTPYIIKPCDGGASENTALIHSGDDLTDWYHENYQDGRIFEAEEFIDGSFYMCDSFVLDNKIIFSKPSQHISPCLEFLSGKPIGAFPLRAGDAITAKILQYNAKVIDVMQPPTGSLHMEFFIKDNEITFIEIAARPPGKTVCKMHEKNYNVNLYELTLREALGLPIDIDLQENLYHCWVGLSTQPGKIEKLNTPSLKSHFDIDWKVKPGDVIHHYPRSINEGLSAEISLYNSDFGGLLEDIKLLHQFTAY